MKMGKLEKSFVNSSRHGRRVARLAAAMLRHIPAEAGQSYLDAGCGTGVPAIHIAKQFGLRVTGIDIDPDQIAEANTKAEALSDVQFQVADMTVLPFDDASFDIVASYKAVHHVANWRDALDELLRVLKPGGYLVYYDFAYPRWMAAVAARFAAGQNEAFITRAELQAYFARQALTQEHRSQAGIFQRVIYRK